MAVPIVGTELKVRAFEVPVAPSVRSDQVIAIDGPINGPTNVTPAVFARDGMNTMPLGTDPIMALQTSRMAVLSGAFDAPQSNIYSLADVMGGVGAMYLGPKAAPPTADNFGKPLLPGHTYYNLNDSTIYVWSSAGKWELSASTLPSVLRAFYYNFAVDTSRIPPNGPLTPDAFGNILSFDVSSEQSSLSGVNVFVNGALLMNGVDYFVREGGAGGDWIELAEEFCASSVAVVQVFASGTSIPFSNSVQLNTTSWIYDSATTFPLLDANNNPIVPNNATNCMISKNNQILQPNVEFTINGDQIVFARPPLASDNVWGVIGLPTTGAIGEFGSRVSPYQFGGVGDGVNDDSDAVKSAIDALNASKATLDFAGGTWRITRQMPTLLYPRVDGGGSGAVFVDYQMVGNPVIDCQPPLGENYAVSAIATVSYDFEGVYSANSTVVRLTLALTTGQVMPSVGEIGKVTATDALVGVETGDSAGQHMAILATDPVNFYVYTAGALVDSYTTAIQFQILSSEQVLLRNFGIYGNWTDVVAEDWIGSFIQVLGARFPKVYDIWVKDGPQGILLAGCFMPSVRSIRGGRMRNATASETPAIPGYDVVDAGSFMSVYMDIGGYDSRHTFTTISPDAATWPRIAWGRSIRPMVNGGVAHAFSAAAFDTHSDAFEPVFANLVVFGGYYGQNSAGSGIQFRGIGGRASNCHVRGTAVGFELYKQFAGEGSGHRLENCSYDGAGTPFRVEREPALSAGNARQTIYVGKFKGISSGSLGIDLSDCDLVIDGTCEIIHTGVGTAATDQRAVFERAAATVKSRGAGRLVYDFSAVTAQTPRLITFHDTSCGVIGLITQVIAGSVDWQALVSENEASAVAVPVGAFKLDVDCDRAPLSVSAGYSQTGASNLLPAGAMQARLLLNGGRMPAARTGAFSLNASMHGSIIPCNGTFTITIPSGAVLGYEFSCMILVTAGTITLDGPGGTNPTVAANNMARVVAVAGVVYSTPFALTTL